MLAAYCQNEEKSSSLKLLGVVTQSHEGGLISDNTHLISSNTSLLSETLANGGMDDCSFYFGPSDDTIIAFGESCGSIAFAGGESCGSIAFSGGSESSGSVASSGGSFSGGCSSGGCCYSC